MVFFTAGDKHLLLATGASVLKVSHGLRVFESPHESGRLAAEHVRKRLFIGGNVQFDLSLAVSGRESKSGLNGQMNAGAAVLNNTLGSSKRIVGDHVSDDLEGGVQMSFDGAADLARFAGATVTELVLQPTGVVHANTNGDTVVVCAP